MFHGSVVALVTPMLEDGTLDIDSLRQLVEMQVENGTNGIVLLGSTGEFATVPREDRLVLIQQTLEQVDDRVPVIVGTGTNFTQSSIELTQQAMELGADACLLVTPYYNKPTQEGLYLHYRAIAEAVAIPQILYNVPSRTVCDLLPETIARLASLPNIIGVKEATGEIGRVQEIFDLCDGNIDLYSGDDISSMPFILAGGKGVISITTNVAPSSMRDMCTAALRGDREEASNINKRLMGLHKCQGIETNPIPTKWELYEMGIIQPGIRLPLTVLSEQHHQAVRNAMHQAGIL